MTCTRIAVLALVLAAGSSGARAQTPSKLSSAVALKDTVVILTFDMYNGADGVAGQSITLNHTLAGKLLPSHFRVSKFVDFHDATWQVYPSTVPRWTSASFDGSCHGTGVARLVAYFQVRAPKAPLQKPPLFAMSNVARDTACVVIGG
jgi:hypothetical protein